MPELTLHHSKLSHSIWALGYAVTAVAIAFLFITRAAEVRFGWLIGLFLVLIIGVPLVEHMQALRDTRPQVIINQQGIFCRAWGADVLPWGHIVAMRPRAGRRFFREVEIYLQGAEEGQMGGIRLLQIGHLDAPRATVWDALRHHGQAALQRGLTNPPQR